MSQVLLLVDTINDFLYSDLYSERLRLIIPSCQQVLSACRNLGVPVVYACDEHTDPKENCVRRWGSHAMVGTRGAEIVEELKPAPTDHVIKKAYNDAFYKSRLEDKLQELETSHVFIVGVMTSYCVRATAEAALNRDLEVAVVDRCTADETDNLHEIGLTLMRALGAEIVPKDEVVYHRLKGARSLARPIME